MRPDVIPFFTIATTSSGLPSIAIRFWKGTLRERIRTIIRQVSRELGVQIVSGVLSREHVHSSSRYHHISRSATLCAGSKAVPRTECRWSSQREFDELI
jgi:hypothetical protein